MIKKTDANRLVDLVDRRFTRHVIDFVFKELVALPKDDLSALFKELDAKVPEQGKSVEHFYITTVAGCCLAILKTEHGYTEEETKALTE